MKRWLKAGPTSAAVVALAGAVTAGNMAHSLTRAKRVSIQENPAGRGSKYGDVSFPTAVDGATLYGSCRRPHTWVLARARPEEQITGITAFFDQALKQQEAG